MNNTVFLLKSPASVKTVIIRGDYGDAGLSIFKQSAASVTTTDFDQLLKTVKLLVHS